MSCSTTDSFPWYVNEHGFFFFLFFKQKKTFELMKTQNELREEKRKEKKKNEIEMENFVHSYTGNGFHKLNTI